MSVHVHWSSNSKLYKFHHHFKYDQCVIFWLKKYVIGQIGLGSYGCHWAGQRRELIYYDCFLFSINTHLFGKRTRICLDLCVWIYLVWWAIITCGRKYQLSEVDAHMEDQLLLALLIGHISPISFFCNLQTKDKEDESSYLNSAAEAK